MEAAAMERYFPSPFTTVVCGKSLIFFKAVAVYQQMLRTDIQLVNSTVHGKKGGIENIDFVNFFGRDDSPPPMPSLFSITSRKV